jgi:hypothetical protein
MMRVVENLQVLGRTPLKVIGIPMDVAISIWAQIPAGAIQIATSI